MEHGVRVREILRGGGSACTCVLADLMSAQIARGSCPSFSFRALSLDPHALPPAFCNPRCRRRRRLVRPPQGFLKPARLMVTIGRARDRGAGGD